MGAALNGIKENLAGDKITSNSKLLNELSDQAQEIIGELTVTIPIDYATERDRIISEMRNADPKPYEDLLYSDYPEKNGREVNKRARNTVVSSEVKGRLADQVNEQLKPTFDEKTKDMNTIMKASLRKALEKAVEKAVDKAVEGVSEQLKQQENETVLKEAPEQRQQ